MSSVVLAVDGGNSKTDVALVGADGSLLALARGPRARRTSSASTGCLDVLDGLIDEALAQAGLERDGVPLADVAELLLAGVDFPSEERAAARARGRPRAGPAARRSATTRSPCFGPGPSAAGASRSSAAPGSTASASRRTGATCASPRSARSRATGAAATTSASRARLAPPRAARTGAAPKTTPRARACPAHFGLDDAASSSPRRSTAAGSPAPA